MRILVLYYMEVRNDRNTIDEHLYSFMRYSGEECYHLNTFFGIPFYLNSIGFDLVVYHYTFTALKWGGIQYFENCLRRFRRLKNLSGYKIAIPQDEYVNSEAVCRFFKDFGIKTVFTCLVPQDFETVYPREISGLEHCITALTGYIDENSIAEVSGFCKDHNDRKMDIGYRARKLPFWLGQHGLVKWKLSERFIQAASGKELRINISNDPSDVFFGKDWYRFLSDCRVVLGCEGGASLHDPDGKIREKVESYVSRFPNADFDEVEDKCFKGLDGNISLFAISPRHFEACMTRTCQALIKGDYAGIFKPGIHYIEIKKDWSNIEDVLRQIQDKKHCGKIADNAYRDIVGSGRYTYREFVRSVLEHVRKVNPQTAAAPSFAEKFFLRLLNIREDIPLLFLPHIFLYYVFLSVYAPFKPTIWKILGRKGTPSKMLLVDIVKKK